MECETLEPAMLTENPDIQTFLKVFAPLLAARNNDAE